MGSAQRRWTNGFLQHGSLLFEDKPEVYLPYFQFSSDQTKFKVLIDYQQKTIALDQIVNPPPTLQTVKDFIRAGFEETFSIRFQKEDLTLKEKERTEKLIQEKYGNDKWNLR